MTDTTATQIQKPRRMQAVQANEWGQITNLEPHQTYYVMRKPQVDVNRERAKELADEFRTFLQEQRLVTEKQVQQFNEKVATPAKARAKEIRVTLERRFDEIAKEVEARVTKIESELHERTPQVFKKKAETSADATTTTTPKNDATPGEMPTGEPDVDATLATDAPATPKKKSTKKND